MQSKINAASSEYVYGFDTPQNGFSKRELANAFEEGAKWQSESSPTISDKELKEVLGLFDIFMPTTIMVDDPKQLAMYNARHLLLNQLKG